MIVITGPGRSGTSVLAQFCLKMGYNPGGSWYDCVDAGMEHPRVAAINDALFLEAMRTGSVQRALEAHRDEMRSLALTVVKDPRFTFHPAILRAWHSVRSDVKVLLTYRTPEHSVASRKRHGRDLVHKEKSRPDVLRRDFANGIETMLDLEIPFVLLLFPNFLTQYEHIYEAFAMLGMSFDHDAGQDVWNTLVNMEKVHFRPAASAQREQTVAAKPRREAGGNPSARLSLMPSRINPMIALSLLVGLICAPIGWKTLEASAFPRNEGQQASLRPTGRLAPLSLLLTPHLVRHWSGSGPFDTAFLQGLSAYSVQRFPFETETSRPVLPTSWDKAIRASDGIEGFCMRRCGSLCASLLIATLLAALGIAPTLAQRMSVPFRNGDFEQGLSGWTVEGDASLDMKAPLAGKRSLRLGPGKSAVRQRVVVGGLRILLYEASLRTVPRIVGAALRAQCYDAQNHLLLDLRQELGPEKAGPKGSRANLYFKTQAHTAYVVLSIEKALAGSGYVYADLASVTPDSHDRVPRPPRCDLNQFMQPLWQGGTVYAETVLLLSEHGRPATGSLLFTPTRILSVQDYAQSITYRPGQDYLLHGKTLTATRGTRMRTVRDTGFPAGDFQWYKLEGKHVVATYTHADAWQGPTPTYRGDLLPHTRSKLSRHLPLTIVAHGDSITLGNDLSGFLSIPPYMPTWPELCVDRLKRVSGDNAIRLYNTALGGATADWGLESAESTVAALNPDLVIVAFGMNDLWSVPVEQFRANIQGIIARVRARRPEAEFILVSPMRYDPDYTSEATYRDCLASYLPALQSLTGPGVQILDMYTLSGWLYAAKKPKDFLSNPMHPNDFLGRWYAQSLVAALIPPSPRAISPKQVLPHGPTQK